MHMFVKDIMKRNVLTMRKDASVKDTLELMIENNAGSVVIVERGEILGIVTERGILSKIVNENIEMNIPIDRIMTKNVITISPNEKIEKAAEIMTENKIKKLPVVMNNKLIGIVTLTDIVASGIRLEDEILEQMAKWFPVAKKTRVGG